MDKGDVLKLKKFSLKIITVVIVLALLVGVVFFTGEIVSDKLGKAVPAMENATEISAKTIEESIRAISELDTLSYAYKDVGQFSDQKIVKWIGPDFPLPFGKKSFNIIYEGEMKIGINMAQVSVQVTDGIITIHMPPAKIMSHVVYEDSVRVLDEKSGLFNQVSVGDYAEFMAECKISEEEKASKSDLFNQALLNAQSQLKPLILSFPGVSEGGYEIRFVSD